MIPRLRTTAVTTCLAAFAGLSSAQTATSPQDYWLGDASGPYATGIVSEMWIDHDRAELTTSEPENRRRLMIRIWYPATYDENSEHAPYAEDIQLYNQWIQSDVGAARDWLTRSLLDAAMDAGTERFPVLLYNPGGGWPNFSGTFQTEFLASHGYVVVSIGRTYQGGIEQFPDGHQYAPDFHEEPHPVRREPQVARIVVIPRPPWPL
jgi:hypothetical protein